METQITKLESLTEQIEKEKDFNKIVDLFAAASNLVKEAMQSTKQNRGKIVEIIRDMDAYIEKELKC